jgi:hypothetical protein
MPCPTAPDGSFADPDRAVTRLITTAAADATQIAATVSAGQRARVGWAIGSRSAGPLGLLKSVQTSSKQGTRF